MAATYSVFQRFVHEILSSTETYRTISSTGVQPKNNVPIHTSTKNTSKTNWKSINRLQTICQVTATDAKKMKLHH